MELANIWNGMGNAKGVVPHTPKQAHPQGLHLPKYSTYANVETPRTHGDAHGMRQQPEWDGGRQRGRPTQTQTNASTGVALVRKSTHANVKTPRTHSGTHGMHEEPEWDGGRQRGRPTQTQTSASTGVALARKFNVRQYRDPLNPQRCMCNASRTGTGWGTPKGSSHTHPNECIHRGCTCPEFQRNPTLRTP